MRTRPGPVPGLQPPSPALRCSLILASRSLKVMGLDLFGADATQPKLNKGLGASPQPRRGGGVPEGSGPRSG